MARAHVRAVGMLGLAAVVIAALLVGLGQITQSSGSHRRSTEGLLPDLDQETPSELRVNVTGTRAEPAYWLGFRSAVRNIGAGPLIVDGTRPDTATPFLRVDQLIDRPDGRRRVVTGVGRMEYAVSSDHRHWHYLQFERYALERFELHHAGSSAAAVTGRKTGFCLGDRYPVSTRVLAAAAPRPVYTGRCGLDEPDRLDLRAGISVGYGDDYAAFLEGQDLPLAGLPDGRYVLVHRVNVDNRLQELSYENNSASVLLDLRWRGGRPYLRVLAKCPDTDRCDRQVRVRTVASGLEIPWDIAFLPDGRAFVTERPGRVRLLDRDGHLVPAPVARITVATQGEGGPLGLALDPEFTDNGFVYVYFTGAASMMLERWRWTGSRLVHAATLVDAIEAGVVHDSGRIGFGPDDRLYVATGDAGQPRSAQDPGSLNGKLLALTAEQYRGSASVRPDVVASGLRNPQGFDWQPGSGTLLVNDHGPSGFDGPEGYDEVNEVVPGGNYGWPNVVGSVTDSEKYSAPLRLYPTPIAPSGGTFLRGAGSPWTGSFVLAALRGEELRRLKITDGRVVVEQSLLQGQFGRLRTVKEGPDGCLYVLTSNRDGRGTPRPGDDRVLCVLLPRS